MSSKVMYVSRSRIIASYGVAEKLRIISSFLRSEDADEVQQHRDASVGLGQPWSFSDI